ncbi:glutamine amidotransferase [Engelhardtia mirabilis]|uniref:von Willebrand factor type A domain protein n=1 Tax=Engelhardtia mirabilis TaxID=2528011 RepID=A0A518BML4_9BACT|nr:von Willebrand factor type A domain protein [Planctomycetes bacterium Pla133]QDV02556.1 von Willebrand factor type A domain protein [Planctomycetes bacterium Pla86]
MALHPHDALFALQGALTEEGSSAALRLLDAPAPWVAVLVIAPILALIAWAGYARRDIARPAGIALASLRFGALALLCVALARPVLVERREEVFPAEVAILVDDSASMRREDAYAAADPARLGLRRLGFEGDAAPSRSDVAARVLERELLPRLAERGYQVRLARFDEATNALSVDERLEGRGQGTHIGDALLSTVQSARGRNLTELVILSDGRNNGGAAPLEAARVAASAGLPVHTLVVGDTRPERNAILELVESPDSALEGDELSFGVRVTGRGSAAGEPVEVLLEELEASNFSDESDVRVLDQRELTLDAAGRKVLLVAPPGPADPTTGERRFRLRLPPLQDETLQDDNSVEVAVRVSPEKVRVLYVEGYPRWEYRKLALDFLKRAESDIDFQGWLASATPGFPQEHSPGLFSLERLPITRDELLDGYDVVILGDVNPRRLFPDPAVGDQFLGALREFVEAGGGLLLQAGEFDNPRAFLGTPLEDVLPVSIDSTGDITTPWDGRRSFRPLLEQPQDPHEIVRMLPDPEQNRALWEDAGGLEGVYWFSPVTRAKPGSQVLLRHPTDENRFGRRPLLVAGYYPSGRTLFVGIDSTWRWQFRYGPRYFERFWKSALRWLALGRLRSGDRRYRIETARASYDLSERIVVEARVLDEDYRPSEATDLEVRWAGPDGRPEGLTLPVVDGREGEYRGGLQVERPGNYRIWIEVDGRRLSSADFEVLLPSRESAEPAPDPQTLAAISAATRGVSASLADLDLLLSPFPGGEERREPISSRLVDVWDRWATLLVVLGLLAAEWLIRKRLELV